LADEEARQGWRYWVGLTLLVLSLILPIVAAVLLPVFGFPESVNAVVMALSLAGGPDVLLVAAAALMGRENIEHVLGRTGSWLGKALRWNSVTQARYVAGL